jgi:hypothetical protein
MERKAKPLGWPMKERSSVSGEAAVMESSPGTGS